MLSVAVGVGVECQRCNVFTLSARLGWSSEHIAASNGTHEANPNLVNPPLTLSKEDDVN